MSTFI